MALGGRCLAWCVIPLLSGYLNAAPVENVNAPQTWNEEKLFKHADKIPQLLEKGLIEAEEVPYPHWRQDGCQSCHLATPKRNSAKLRSKDINALCNNCHNVISVHSYIHAVGMVPSAEKLDRMPGQFRQAIKRGGGVVTCIACHDLPIQCKKERIRERRSNLMFFRGGPYTDRTDLCFNCHNPEHYARLNPHDQISDEGELNTEVCLICHSVAPNRRAAKSIDDVKFNVTEDLAILCTGCHTWTPHPGGSWASFARNSDYKGPNHLVKPPEQIQKNLKQSELRGDVVLPLDPSTGKIFCATCHNPHERGVQRYARTDHGADGYRRLRITPGLPICNNCHDK